MIELLGLPTLTKPMQYAVFIVFTGATFFFIDKVGRRTLLIWGAIGMGFCHFVVGGVMGQLIHLQRSKSSENMERALLTDCFCSNAGAHKINIPGGIDGNPNVNFKVVGKNAQNAVVTFSYLLIVVYSITLAPVCWIYAAEVWSLGTRATGMGLASLSNWLFNFALGLFLPPGFQNIQWKIFMVFGTLCGVFAIWTYVLYPETCGKTLEEIEFMFSSEGPHAWQTKKGESRLSEEIEAVKHRKNVENPAVMEGEQEKA